jgi:3-deoxy-D-manno-octulosonic-acid transferase
LSPRFAAALPDPDGNRDLAQPVARLRAGRCAGLLVNARLSEKSLRGYRRIGALIRPALRQLRAVAAQSEADAARLAVLGAGDIRVCGNTKYDFTPPPAQLALGAQFRERIGQRPVWLCASTRDGEEALILAAWRAAKVGDALLLLVPRHPERFAGVAALAAEQGFAVQRRSDPLPVSRETRVWIGDSMGEAVRLLRRRRCRLCRRLAAGFRRAEPDRAGQHRVPCYWGHRPIILPRPARLALAAGAARQVADAGAQWRWPCTLLATTHRSARRCATPASRFHAASWRQRAHRRAAGQPARSIV